MEGRSNQSPLVLLADDDQGLAEGLAKILGAEGFRVSLAFTGKQTLEKCQEENPDLVLLDLKMPDAEGISLLREIHEKDGSLPIILMTGYATVSTAVESIQGGAYDFIEKPVRRDVLLPRVRKAIDLHRMSGEILRLREELQQLKLAPIVGHSFAIRRVMQQISSVASTPHTTVLVHGESGVGKELVARAIHDASARQEKPFVAVNCAALTESLLEAELFGYEKGSFTGAANTGKQGLFSAAEGGTIFLDEISELAPGLQAKLLRSLQERTIRRVGGEKDIPVDVRIVTSTNRSLGAAVSSGKFRQDLFFRLHVMTIEVPPLRDRKEDIPLLSHYFLEQYNRELGKGLRGFSAETVQALMNYEWPGNVRELKNAIERACIVAAAPLIQPGDLLLRFIMTPIKPNSANVAESISAADRSIRGMERALIEEVLQETDGNISKASEVLGINRTTLYNKMRAYSLAKPCAAVKG